MNRTYAISKTGVRLLPLLSTSFTAASWHGHLCVNTAGVDRHAYTWRAMRDTYQETLERDAYASGLGYGLIVV